MSKRSASGIKLPTQFHCKPCGMYYDNEHQLIRHKDDRHGAQVVCSICKGHKSCVVPKKRTDVQRRHLVAKHAFPKEVDVTTVKLSFVPYFEECDTPAFQHTIRSEVTIPTSQVTTITHMDTQHIHAAPATTTTPTEYQYIATPLQDSTTVPYTLEAFLSEQATTPENTNTTTPATPDNTLHTPKLQLISPTKTKLPKLSLDWTFPNPQLSMPVRYATPSPLPELTISPKDLPQTTQEESSHTPSMPLSPTPETTNTPTIPLECIHGDSNTNISTNFPAPRPNHTEIISGVDNQRIPEFPPRRLEVSARKSLDPRLLFRDAPSEFLAGSMARLAAYQRKEITKQATQNETHVTFQHQNFTITRTEQIQLEDGRTLTMKTSCLLDDNIKVTRATQTQTDEDIVL